MRRLKNQNGVTLLELLAALAIFSLIGTIMFSLIINAFSTFDDGMSDSRLVKETEFIEMKIKDVARNTLSFSELEENVYAFHSSSPHRDDVVFMWEEEETTLLTYDYTPYDDEGAEIPLEVQAEEATSLSDKVTYFNLTISEDGRTILYDIQLMEDTQAVEVSGSGSVFIPNWR